MQYYKLCHPFKLFPTVISSSARNTAVRSIARPPKIPPMTGFESPRPMNIAGYTSAPRTKPADHSE
ncbi:hypothetical protein [Methanolobus vulcani]|uniref:Uncharacterized protein n=1 Tax=Methanolobus vulcani TaxID=38026 RepID=A0A7Z8P3E9_9EURY|nr:hypothetical protein [Methanolobus vulcani]TQD28227.1 hypothetical protein FKV42_00705 [Methanolobus vulcani]